MLPTIYLRKANKVALEGLEDDSKWAMQIIRVKELEAGKWNDRPVTANPTKLA